MAKVGIVDYGMGNLRSIYNALTFLGADAEVCDTPSKLKEKTHLVIPGVGAFGQCVKELKRAHFFDSLQLEVLEKKKPTLGICLGMQVMATAGTEGGRFSGLGWFNADVISLKASPGKYTVPHTGWEEIQVCQSNPLFNGLPKSAKVYFVHSYHMLCKDSKDVAATCEHTTHFAAAIRKENIFGLQFHPEKSQTHGLKILENFVSWSGSIDE